MESFYSAPLDTIYISALGLEYERVALTLVTVSFKPHCSRSGPLPGRRAKWVITLAFVHTSGSALVAGPQLIQPPSQSLVFPHSPMGQQGSKHGQKSNLGYNSDDKRVTM